jgi:hypothetical protein
MGLTPFDDCSLGFTPSKMNYNIWNIRKKDHTSSWVVEGGKVNVSFYALKQYDKNLLLIVHPTSSCEARKGDSVTNVRVPKPVIMVLTAYLYP